MNKYQNIPYIIPEHRSRITSSVVRGIIKVNKKFNINDIAIQAVLKAKREGVLISPPIRFPCEVLLPGRKVLVISANTAREVE